MFGLGLSEIIFIAVLALIFIGPKQLPEVARTLGRFLNELKRSTSDLTDELKAQARIDRLDLYSTPKRSEAPKTATGEPAGAHDAATAIAPVHAAEKHFDLKGPSAGHESPSEPKQIELFPLNPEKKDV